MAEKEDHGVRADGVDYSSIAAYKKAKGESNTGGTNPNPGGNSGIDK